MAVAVLVSGTGVMKAADGDTFIAKSTEGIEMTFKVISEADKTCQVGNGSKVCLIDPYNGEGTLTIPEKPNGYQVTTVGDNAFYGCKQMTKVIIPESVAKIGDYAFYECELLDISAIPVSVKSLGRQTFYGCNAIKTITVPASVEEMGGGTFENCAELSSVTLGNGIKKVVYEMFAYCKKLKTINLPVSIELIDEMAFYLCESMEELTMPQNLTTIKNSAFERTGLKHITWNNAIRTLGYEVFSGCPITEITVPGYITEMGGILAYCQDLTTVTFSEGISEVPNGCFENCSKLSTVNLPSTITKIGKNAFRDTESLTQLVIPEGCTEIGESAFLRSGVKKVWIPSTMQKTNKAFKDSGLEEAVLAEGLTSVAGFFQNATNLKRVHLPASVVNITDALNGCSEIETLSVDPENTVFDSRNGCNGIIETATNTLVRACSTTTIPATVTAIGDYAYNGVGGISDLVMPQQVKKIGEYAFASTSLKSITLPDGIESIGKGALSNTRIEEFTLPQTIDVVPEKLLYQCKQLTKVTLHDKTIGIRNMAFSETQKLTTIELPTSITYIGGGTFASSNLENITIPSTVEEIGRNCFGECRKLENVVIEGSPKLVIYQAAFTKTWIKHFSFLTNAKALNGCGREAFYPDKMTYQAYFDETIHENFKYTGAFDPFIGIMSEDEWMPILCSQKNFQLPEGIEAYIVTGVAGGKTQMQQVQSINKGQAVLLRLKDRTKASEVIKMASGDLLRYETKELDDSEVTFYEGGAEYRVAVGFTNIYADNQDKVMFVFENGVFVRKLVTEVNGLTGYIVLDPEEAGDMATITIGDDKPGVKGDADGNGKVEPADVTFIEDLIFKGKYTSQADVNKDKKVNAADIVEVVKIINKSK